MQSAMARRFNLLHDEINQLRARITFDEEAAKAYRAEAGKLIETKSEGDQALHQRVPRPHPQAKPSPVTADEVKKRVDELKELAAYVREVVGPLDAARSGLQLQQLKPTPEPKITSLHS